MKRIRLLLTACAFLFMGLSVHAIDWTDKTSLITNPSFETDAPVSNATKSELNSASVTGWTILPTTTVSNAQAAVVNSSSTLSVLSGSDGATTGSKYFYVRQNWNNTGNFGIQQVIAAGQPAGLYMLTCKIKTSSSTPGSSSWTLSIQEGDKTAVTNTNAGSAAEWLNYGVLLYKESDETAITISAYMVAGASGNGQHYAMLLDDFQLKYISLDDFAAVTEENPLDMTGAIYNEGIYNASKTALPRGWQEYGRSGGNGNFTEGTGNTQLEGWAADNADFSRDYYQTINGLPEGKYKVTANCHDTNNRGAYLYIYSDGARQSVNMPTAYADITTPALNVSNGSINIGIKLENKKGTWMTGDNFRLTYIGSELNAKKLELRNLKTDVTDNYLNNSTYSSVVGSDRTALSTAAEATAAEETLEAYQTVIDALNSALNSFVAQYNAYNALTTEISKASALGASTTDAESALADENRTQSSLTTAIQALKVAEYNYVSTTYQYGVSLGEWTSTGTNTSAADFSNEHWSGETRTYKNQNDSNGQGWNANSWEIHFSQDVTLPAGNYVFKVAGRQAAGDAVNTSLVVKLGDHELGSVNDFPRSNSSRGINKSGATAFEGDNSEFAHDGAGYGWEWRYVKFILTEDATVNIAIHSVATAKYQWVSFGDYTVQTDEEANISLIAYNIALNDAIAARDAAANKYVGGTDRSNLVAAIAADEGLDKTDADAIDAATTALNTARETFLAGVSDWNAYTTAKNTTYEDNQPYASAEKYAAIATAKSGAVPNTASEAAAKAAAITSAYRLYVESNAMAEGVSGAENKTTLISDPNMEVTYDGTAHTFGAWQVFGQTDGNIQLLSAESFTDGSGKNDYKYADIYKSDNNAGIKQTISNLAPGKYMLTVTARAQTTADATFGVFAGSYRTEINRIGASRGVFDRGWNDASVEFYVTETSDVEIGVQSGNGKDLWWSATRFRLVKLPTPEVTLSETDETAPEAQTLANVTLTRTLSASYWSTFSVPFNAAKPDGWTVKEFDSTDGNIINFTTAESIVAGKPYLVKPTADVVNPTFYDVTVVSTAGNTDGEEGDYQFAAQIYNKSLATDGTIAYLATDGSIKKLTSGGIKGLRAYFIIPASANANEARIHFMEENETTGINSIDNGQLIMDNGAAYDLQGRKVQNPKRGMYIINGKKVVIK